MEEGVVPISAIEHFAYCPRQTALIHVDSQWQASVDTAQGEADHAAVDQATRRRTRRGVVEYLSLPVWSDSLGVYGVCDVVEMSGPSPVPVEHKPTLSRWARSPAAQQLAAQAMCLEEMWSLPVPIGVLFTRRDQRRHVIEIDEGLRTETRRTVAQVRELLEGGSLPEPVDDRRCVRCSLLDLCKAHLPRASADPFVPAAEGGW